MEHEITGFLTTLFHSGKTIRPSLAGLFMTPALVHGQERHPSFQGKLYAFEFLKSWRPMGETTCIFIRSVSKFLPVLDGFLPLKILEFVSDFGALPDTTGLLCLE